MKKYFEYTDAVSNKFWEINLKGKQVTLTYGRIGIKNPAQIVKKFKPLLDRVMVQMVKQETRTERGH